MKYYPQDKAEEIINQILSKLEVKKLNSNLTTNEEKWDEIKKLERGDQYFVVNYSKLSEKCQKTYEDIISKKLKVEDCLYDNTILFDVFCCWTYFCYNKKFTKLTDLKGDELKQFIFKLLLNEVDLEDLKNVVLTSNILNIDAILDSGKSDYNDLVKGYEFVYEMINLIDEIKDLSSHDIYYDLIKNSNGNMSLEDLKEKFNSFDEKFFENILKNRINNTLLEVLFRVRLIKIDSPRWFMELPVIKEYYEKRPKNPEIKIEKDGMFTYKVSDEGLQLVDELISGKMISASDIDLLKEDGLLSDKEYEDYLTAVQVFRTVEESSLT